MGLIQSMEKQGNFLFKYRGQFPVILFLLVIPFVHSTDYHNINLQNQKFSLYIAITISIIGTLVRFYTIGTTTEGTSGRNTEKQVATVLNSTGIYSMLRHPLYFGNYLIWLGIAISTFNFYFIIIMSLIFWIYYERIIFAEEQFLKKKFGVKFSNWSVNLPAFFPSLLQFKKSKTPFSMISVLRREYSGVLATIIAFTYIEVLRNYFKDKVWEISTLSCQFLIVIIVIVLVLRSLKHYTKILDETGRS